MNTINITESTIKIDEIKKTLPISLIMAILIFLFQSLLYFKKYNESGEDYDLFIAITLGALLLIALGKLFFFVSFKKEISISEISGVEIQKILFGKGKVYFRIKFSGRTRDVLLTEEHANTIREQLEPKLKQA